MSDDDTIRFSPYLILGVDVGASAAEANRAFARRVKEVADGRIELSQQDLNWAQTQFRRADELAGSLDYLRVPVGSAQPPEIPAGTLFHPAPEPLPRRTSPVDPEVIAAIHAEVQRAAIIELIRSFDVRPAAPYGDAPSPQPTGRRPGGVS